jgi:ankyrin repeat protein
VFNGHLEDVRLLMNAEALINLAENDGVTPL